MTRINLASHQLPESKRGRDKSTVFGKTSSALAAEAATGKPSPYLQDGPGLRKPASLLTSSVSSLQSQASSLPCAPWRQSLGGPEHQEKRKLVCHGRRARLPSGIVRTLSQRGLQGPGKAGRPSSLALPCFTYRRS